MEIRGLSRRFTMVQISRRRTSPFWNTMGKGYSLKETANGGDDSFKK
jgi:hypothetical protein